MRLRPISDLVVAAGLSWILIVQAREVLSHPALSPTFLRFASPARRQAFERLTAIDLDALEQVVAAGYPDSTLFVLDGVASPQEAEKRFRDGLLHDVVRKSYRPDATWTHGRTAAGKVRSLSALSPGIVAIEGGARLHAKVALLYAIGRLRRSPRALSLPDLSMVADALGDAAVVGLAPGPFVGPWEHALHGMLGVCTAAGLGVRIDDQGLLDVGVRLAGAWSQDADRAADNALSGWRELAESSIGRLLRLDHPIDGPRPITHDSLVGLDVRLDGPRLLHGLYDVVAADVAELMDVGSGATR